MNAIDGNKDNNYWHGSCSHTDVGDRQPTWTLSLLKNLTVNRYVIYNRDEGLFCSHFLRFMNILEVITC